MRNDNKDLPKFLGSYYGNHSGYDGAVFDYHFTSPTLKARQAGGVQIVIEKKTGTIKNILFVLCVGDQTKIK